jgi:thiol:disulfide interchange protein
MHIHKESAPQGRHSSQWNTGCIRFTVNMRTIVWLSFSCLVATLLVARFHNQDGARSAIDDALSSAHTAHKSLMVEFGAEWCNDCQALSRELQQEPLKTCVDKSVNRLKIDVGEFNRNLDTASRLGIDIKNGVIPTAVFFSPATSLSTTKIGTREILTFLKQSCP